MFLHFSPRICLLALKLSVSHHPSPVSHTALNTGNILIAKRVLKRGEKNPENWKTWQNRKKTETDVETLIYKMSTELALTGQVSENSKTELGR